MRRFIYTIVAMLCTLTVAAQVTRQVEVTKQYVPKLPPAHKLDMVAEKLDTVTIRPEIDYTIVPKSFDSALATSNFRPATITYWEYNKQYPFYVKLGAGFPIASEVDVYATTNRADVGYLTGYVNHRGRFSKIKGSYDLAGETVEYANNPQQMVNRIGANGGVYIGRYTLDGNLYYQSDIYHRYPLPTVEEAETAEVNYENVAAKISFGDSFADLSKLNFALYAAADYYNDKSDMLLLTDESRKLQQFTLNAGAKVARNITERMELLFSIDYDGYYGLKSYDGYLNSIVSAGVMYGYRANRILALKAGITYSYDKLSLAEKGSKSHILPYLYLGADAFDNGVVVPYVEFESELVNNSFQSLQRINPYVAMPAESITLLPNTRVYNARVGLSGHITGNKFAYRLYAAASIVSNSLFWYSPQPAYFDVKVGKERVWSFVGSLEYKPLSQLYIAASVNGMLYTVPEDLGIENYKPSIEGNLAVRYTHRKFAIGATADVVGATRWSVGSTVQRYPAYVDLGVTFDWFVGKRCTIYLEGRNLTNAKIHHWALYKEYGAGGVFGIKVQF